ncbi:DUF2927 domain-containing protein [Halocynthiibacter namhaensis]|uniref:DUF2927 domain-containing protein n=1 Tax=Halocynthiibacter namhaensis TaxID=1290553 RepID=UPI0006922B29|nr:DUF2927 domain-containing protein [Halocynthiibacter namhaensis]
MLHRIFASVFMVTGLAFTAGCTPATGPVSEVQQNRLHPDLSTAGIQTSQQSLAMKQHLAQTEQASLSSGRMRRDTAPSDARFTRSDLVENFMAIALFNETNAAHGQMRRSPAPLRRWNSPIRFGVYFGQDVPPNQQRRDLASISDFARQLSNASRHSVTVAAQNPNFHVLVLNEHERKSWHQELRQIIPDLRAQDAATILSLPRHKQCQMFAWDPQNSGVFNLAVAVIRAEHPDLTRLSCFHEELAQGLGLPNDSPDARPSIFNDDEEFGLLTRHDELLLRILYDPRLRPGMSASQARPIVEKIVADLKISTSS